MEYAPFAGPGRRCAVTLAYKIMPKGTRPEDLTSRFEPPSHVEVRRETAEASVAVDPAPAHPNVKRRGGASSPSEDD
jgi:hypothetical protein